MKMSTKGRYGLRIMMELASHYGRGPLLVADIAHDQKISGKYIHVLITNLKTSGLVRAVYTLISEGLCLVYRLDDRAESLIW
jgi:Rrf2 family cysteine metabolism transcriptional repressor